MSDHEHVFGPVKPKGTIGFCRVEGCAEMRVANWAIWRKLTVDEQISVTAYMMEELAMVDAMRMIHGPERGLARYKYLRQGDPPA